MSELSLAAAVESLGMAVFERRTDGAFAAVGHIPEWFRCFGRTDTFPFLGSFLDQANAFWAKPRALPLRWGPCAQIDDSGHQVQFIVSATSSLTHQFLIFEPDWNAADMQRALQTAREQALTHEQAMRDVRASATAIFEMSERLRGTIDGTERAELLAHLSRASARLIARVDAGARS